MYFMKMESAVSQVEGDTPKTTYLIDRTFGYTYLIK